MECCYTAFMCPNLIKHPFPLKAVTIRLLSLSFYTNLSQVSIFRYYSLILSHSHFLLFDVKPLLSYKFLVLVYLRVNSIENEFFQEHLPEMPIINYGYILLSAQTAFLGINNLYFVLFLYATTLIFQNPSEQYKYFQQDHPYYEIISVSHGTPNLLNPLSGQPDSGWLLPRLAA